MAFSGGGGANAPLQWVNDIMASTINTNNAVRSQLNSAMGVGGGGLRGHHHHHATSSSASAASLLPLRSATDLSSADYAQLIAALRPASASRFTFAPPNNTPREIHEAHLRNYQSAVAEMGSLIPPQHHATSIDASSSSSSAPLRLSLPQRLCQGDPTAHQALLAAIYSQRRLFPPQHEYDWARARQRLEEKELMPDGKPIAWNASSATTGACGGVGGLDPNRHIMVDEADRITIRLLTASTGHLESALSAAMSLPIYLTHCGTMNTSHDASYDQHADPTTDRSSGGPHSNAEASSNKENRHAAGAANSTNNAAAVVKGGKRPRNVHSANGEALLTPEPMAAELFSLMLLALGETPEEESRGACVAGMPMH